MTQLRRGIFPLTPYCATSVPIGILGGALTKSLMQLRAAHVRLTRLGTGIRIQSKCWKTGPPSSPDLLPQGLTFPPPQSTSFPPSFCSPQSFAPAFLSYPYMVGAGLGSGAGRPVHIRVLAPLNSESLQMHVTGFFVTLQGQHRRLVPAKSMPRIAF